MKYIANENDENRTILKILERILYDVPKSRIQKAIRNKDIKINHKKINDSKIKVKCNDQIEMFGIVTRKREFSFIKYDFQIIYEDNNILIINKKNNITMHGHSDSLDNQVLSYLKFEYKDSFIPSHFGRLDGVASGLVIYAKNYISQQSLIKSKKDIEKIYQIKSDIPEEGEFVFYFERDLGKRKMKISKEKKGKKGTTIVFFEDNRKLVKILTGRKHQIRATLSHLNYPIYGDRLYGGKRASHVFLHCTHIKMGNMHDNLSYLSNSEFHSKPNW